MHILLSPLGSGLLIALFLLVAWRLVARWLRMLLILAELFLLVLCCPFGANVLVKWVESGVTAPCAEPVPQTIVLLAAGLQREPARKDDFVALEEINIDRMLAAVALWRRTPDARSCLPAAVHARSAKPRCSGNWPNNSVCPRFDPQRKPFAKHVGKCRAIARTQPPLPARIPLVSSALHLPRALVAFRAAGFQPCAVIPIGVMCRPAASAISCRRVQR